MVDRIERTGADGARGAAEATTSQNRGTTATESVAVTPPAARVAAAPPAVPGGAAVPTSPAVAVPDRSGAPGLFGRRTRVTGTIDASSGNAVLHDLLHAAVTGETLLVDLANVEEIDEAGLAILHTARRQARMIGGDLVLAGVPDRLSCLLSDFTTEEDLPHP